VVLFQLIVGILGITSSSVDSIDCAWLARNMNLRTHAKHNHVEVFGSYKKKVFVVKVISQTGFFSQFFTLQ